MFKFLALFLFSSSIFAAAYEGDSGGIFALPVSSKYISNDYLVFEIDGKNYESVTFQSIITNNCHQKITKNYKSKVLNSLKKYNVPKSYLDKINNLKYFNINFFLISFLILLIYIIKCNLI